METGGVSARKVLQGREKGGVLVESETAGQGANWGENQKTKGSRADSRFFLWP